MDRFLQHPTYTASIIASLFFMVLFLQSGLDKVVDWKGNIAWLGPHFSKSPLRAMVPLLLGIITVFELATGALSGIAAVMLLTNISQGISWYVGAMGLAALTITMLFTGQRLAKDYAGAGTLAVYFAVALLSLAMGANLSASTH